MIPGSHKLVIPGHGRKDRGLEYWRNHNGLAVMRLHYSVDPEKDESWVEKAAKAFPGGRNGPAWRGEMECDPDAHRGGRVFPDFAEATHVFRPVTIERHWKRYRVIDPGYRHECACAWFAIDDDGTVWLYREHYQAGWNVERNAAAIKALSGKEKYEFTLIDPSAFQKTLAGGGRSVADLFVDAGLIVNPAYRSSHKKDQIPALAALINLQDNGEPRFKVFDTCPNAIRELKNYRWRTTRSDEQDAPEEPVKIDDDVVDCCLYMALSVDPEAVREQAERENRDPYSKWYSGSDRRRQKADDRRLRNVWHDLVASRDSEEDP